MASQYKVSYTPEALDDLRHIVESISEIAWIRSAEKWAKKIITASESLAVFPEGNPIYEYDNKCRTAKVGKYKIIYEVYNRERIVSILRIIYARRNLKNILNR